MSFLRHPALMKRHSFIDGRWIEGEKKATFPVVNPFDQTVITQVAEMGAQEARAAIEAAHRALPKWKALPPSERGHYLLAWEELIRTHQEDLSTLLTFEEGKPFEQATHEFMGCSGFLKWYAEEAKRLHGYTLTSPDPSRRFFTLRQPVGVVAMVTPWNFPSVLPIQKCAPALAAGCTVVLKPAEDTPLSALALAYLAEKAGFPPGVFNVIACHDPTEVGRELLTHPLVRKFSFTGSTEVGKALSATAAHTVKNTCLELGGNCPALIFDDADLDQAVSQTFWPKFYNGGQCCNNINRFLVHESVYRPFIDQFHAMIKEHMRLGSGMEAATTLGPLINKQGIDKVDRLVHRAVEEGATVVTGGKLLSPHSLCYHPTLLSHVTPTMSLYRAEIFGPVAPIYRFTTESEAISMANDTPYGLAAYLFSQNPSRMWRVAEALEAGSIGVNTCDVTSELLPFGGWKESGIGRENGAIGSLDGYLEQKSVVLGGMSSH